MTPETPQDVRQELAAISRTLDSVLDLLHPLPLKILDVELELVALRLQLAGIKTTDAKHKETS